jgi:hypothetical protein
MMNLPGSTEAQAPEDETGKSSGPGGEIILWSMGLGYNPKKGTNPLSGRL